MKFLQCNNDKYNGCGSDKNQEKKNFTYFKFKKNYKIIFLLFSLSGSVIPV